jgi:LuxR family maltose regulon positive regulatory protein
MLLTEAALVRSRMGQREAAERELKLVVPGWSGATVGLASLALAAGDAESAGEYVVDALNCLEQLIPADRVEAWALDALVGDVLADHERASRSIERALDLAEPGGYRQALVAQGAVLQPILVRQLRLGTAHRAFVEDLLLALDDGAERGSGKPQLAEPLTGREAAILRFLPTTMSNHQIASELFVSVNTIKTHLRSIYRKLDAGDRREAVVKAREMQLLAPGIARRAWLQSLPRR